MADEKETKLEIVDIPKPLKDLENTIRDVFPKIAKIGQDMGKDLAGAIIKGYENMGYEFREVEITIDEQEIKDYGFITAYKNTLKTMLKRVKNTNFHTAVGANTDYKKINSVPILWRDEKTQKLDYDAREKDLTRWFSESLENKIKELSTTETLQY